MEFIKKHYEKVLLGLVLFGLVVAVAMLPLKIQSERAALETKKNEIIKGRVAELEKVDLSKQTALLQRFERPERLKLAPPHNLFNPVTWQEAPDGRLIKVATGKEIGPQAVQITRISDLHTIITLDSVSGSGYLIGVEKQAALRPQDRRKRQTYARAGEKSELFILRDAKGPPEDPQLVLEMLDTGDAVTISRDNPFRRVDGHMADLKYDPEKKTFREQRVGSTIVVAGEPYNIVAIDPTSVVLSAPNGKKTIISTTNVAESR